MEAHFDRRERDCIRLLADWFLRGKTSASRKELIEELGIQPDQYDPLMMVLVERGLVALDDENLEDLEYAPSFSIMPRAVQVARDIERQEQEAEAARDVVKQVESAVRRRWVSGGLKVALLAFGFLITVLNQLVELLQNLGLLGKP